jgi:hypothetical protein
MADSKLAVERIERIGRSIIRSIHSRYLLPVLHLARTGWVTAQLK